jgi:hypothetical protein
MGAPAKAAHDVAETTNGLEGSIERHTGREAGRIAGAAGPVHRNLRVPRCAAGVLIQKGRKPGGSNRQSLFTANECVNAQG